MGGEQSYGGDASGRAHVFGREVRGKQEAATMPVLSSHQSLLKSLGVSRCLNALLVHGPGAYSLLYCPPMSQELHRDQQSTETLPPCVQLCPHHCHRTL